jgi:predicted dehydrogenase
MPSKTQSTMVMQQPAVERPVRLASIGAGMIGQLHAGIARHLDGCEYLALCDADPAKQQLATDLGVKYYTDYIKMIEEEQPDGVIIAVPNEAHDEVGVECARRGAHLFMEKPIASTLEAADRLIEGARANNVKLYIAHHRRFNPLINAARAIVRGGELGTLVGVSVLWAMYKPAEYFVAGPWRKRKGGGPVLINTIHEIDNLRYIHGEIDKVYADVGKQGRHFDVEDTVSVSLRFTDGALASIMMSDTVPSLWSYESTTGENPFFQPTVGDIYHFLGTKASLAFPSMAKVFYAEGAATGWQHPINTAQSGIQRRDPYVDQLKHFCQVVRGTEPPRTSGEDARRTLALTLALHESARTGRAISL